MKMHRSEYKSYGSLGLIDPNAPKALNSPSAPIDLDESGNPPEETDPKGCNNNSNIQFGWKI